MAFPSANPFPAPPAPAPKKRNVALILALVIGVPVGGLLLLVGLGVLLSATGKELPVTDADREAVITIEEIADRMTEFDVRPGVAKLSKRKLLDGSYELDYEYDTSADAEGGLYVNCVVSVEKNNTDAVNSYLGMKLGGAAGFALAGGKGVKLVDRDELLKWGDDSRAAVLTVDGKPGGNFFITRKGRRIFHFIVAGVFFDEPEHFSSMLLPKLERLAAYQP